ncbi:MAG TPA: hypothetical protein VF406_09010 [Thermodesulfobacteriota bacterium]
MHDTQEGRDVLQRTDQTTRFDELPGGADAAYARIRELLEPGRR